MFESRKNLWGFVLLYGYSSITGQAFVPSRPHTKLVAEPADVNIVEEGRSARFFLIFHEFAP
jgi:hypothetical protein